MDTKQPDVLCLAPCPFCGGGARRTTVGTNAWFGTGCDGDQSCPAHLRALTHKTQAEADAAWNRRAPAPASSEPVAVHTDPEGYQDGAWYWVKINGFGGNSIMAPAMYRANCGAWYSHEFIGISTRFLDVLGPCTLASDIYTAAQVQAGAPVVLPEPVAYSHGLAKYAHSSNIIAANEFTPDTEHADEWENLYTEQQVRAMLATGGQAQAVPVANCYSDDDGDRWRDRPDDCEFVEGRALGEEFELQASIRSWTEVFRVTKVPDENSDDYEVEPVSMRTTSASQVQADAPVVLPAPDAVLRFERSTAGKENEMPIVVSCNWLPDGEYKLYTEQQVRALLAAAPKPPAPSGPALEPVDKSPNLQGQAVDKSPETQGCGPAREPLTPEQLVTCMQLAGFTTWDSRMWELKRQVEAALGITAAQKGDAHGQPT